MSSMKDIYVSNENKEKNYIGEMLLRAVHNIWLGLTATFLCLIILVGQASAAEFSTELSGKLEGSVVLFLNKSKAYVGTKEVKINNENSSIVPLKKDSRTLVPVRFIAEALGAKVDWNQKTRTVLVTLNNKAVSMTIDNSTILINNKPQQVDVPAQIIGDSTYLPLRALAEALDKKVFWDDRGLIVISPSEMLDATRDKTLINELVSSFVLIRLNPATIDYDWKLGFDYERRLYREIENGTRRIQVTSDKVQEIIVNNGWVYYTMHDKGGIKRVKVDGTSAQQLLDANVHNINVGGGWIYYITEAFKKGNDYTYAIEKMKVDGGNSITIAERPAYDLQLAGEWLYYTDNRDNDTIYRMDTNGLNDHKVIDAKTGRFIVKDGWIYFENRDDDSKVYKAKSDGSSLTKMTEQKGAPFYVADGKLFYIIEGNKITSINLDGVVYENTSGQAGNGQQENPKNDKNQEQNNTGTKVSSSHKITDKGFVWQVDDSIYLSYNGLKKGRLNSTDISEVPNLMDTRNFVTDGEWIYSSDYDGLYKVKMDGTGKTKLNLNIKDAAIEKVDGEWIYFYTYDKGLSKIKLDGSNRVDLGVRELPKPVMTAGGKQFVVLNDDQIFTAESDGKPKKVLVESNTGIVKTDGEWIYYTNSDEEYTLYKVKVDGSGKSKIVEDVSNFDVSNGYVYYSQYSKEKNKLYRIKNDGTDKKILAEIQSGGYLTNMTPAVIGDWVYVWARGAEGWEAMIMVKVDGSQKKDIGKAF